ncbi:unnamed protein product [Diatraea saccharalis]|uniref:Uncharacterized protein n=1 Tax=Diatraea saccharalis TaxID=40085 RepID=A0A9N9RC00_9NEOP|nr:unnamed protein product [Diatraea saccharalis]
MKTTLLAIGIAWWSIAIGNLEVRPVGWLGNLVQYHRQKLIQDVRDEAPIQVKASIHPRPEGYVDSPLWNVTSVLRLMALVRRSAGAGEVRAALRRMLTPRARRMKEYFEEDDGTNILDEDAVLIISNPVEARLPSAQISVKLLKSVPYAHSRVGEEGGAIVLGSTNMENSYDYGDVSSSAGDVTADGATSAAPGADANAIAPPPPAGDATEAAAEPAE